MSSSSLEVKIENGTRSSTLRFFHRTGFHSSHRRELKTLSPPSGDLASFFPFRFEEGTNEMIDVEYKVEMENQENETANVRQRTYKSAGVRIDSTILRENSGIRVVDSEAAQGSSEKFELRLEPRADMYEAGWIVTFVMMLYTLSGLKYAIIGFKYVYSGFRNLISATQPSVPTAEPPANAAEPPANATRQMVPAVVSSAINYISNLKIWTHLYPANPNEGTLPTSSRHALR